MRKLVAAAVVTAFITAPVVAQDLPTFTAEQVATATAAIEDLALDDDTYRDLWCGAAFIAITNYLKTQGNAEAATEAESMGMTLFARVETTLLPKALTTEQLNAIGANSSIVVISQMGPDGEAEYSQEECTAAVKAQ